MIRKIAAFKLEKYLRTIYVKIYALARLPVSHCCNFFSRVAQSRVLVDMLQTVLVDQLISNKSFY